eukprot:TRINITY_DN786_c0_g1_i4.p1 TRINITY_DN786_c0_g1~~TRINITY_DN786_c0_g1_i4.p1  ORF type:complete len:916 (+),score=181.33 TRINITY_DN786_c0_g1_i4:48-2795(+)
MVLYLLYESAIGYALFKLKSFDETNAQLTQIQNQVKDFGLFSQICEIKGFIGFNAQTALENVIQVCSGQLSENLQTFLEQNIQKSKKQGVVQLAVQDNKLAKEISEKLGIECKTNDNIFELFRGIRQHFVLFLKSETFTQNDLDKAELGLAHQFSRTRIALDVKRQDKPIIQSSAVLEQLDKDLNTFCMRIKEWYSWHFPELQKIVTDNEIYVKLVDFIKDKQTLLKKQVKIKIIQQYKMNKKQQSQRPKRGISLGPIYQIKAPSFNFEEASKDQKFIESQIDAELNQQSISKQSKQFGEDNEEQQKEVFSQKKSASNSKLKPIQQRPKLRQQSNQMVIDQSKAQDRFRSTTEMQSLKQQQQLNLSFSKKEKIEDKLSWIDDLQRKEQYKFIKKPARNPERIEQQFASVTGKLDGSKVFLDKKDQTQSKDDNQISEYVDPEFAEFGYNTNKTLINFDCYEEEITPQQWVLKYKNTPPPHGQCPIYINKQYDFTQIEVKGYNEEKKKFIVKMLTNGQVKLVTRLSLIFKDENTEAFTQRKEFAKYLQKQANEEIRYYRYIDQQPSELVKGMKEEWKHEILDKLSLKKNRLTNQDKKANLKLDKQIQTLLTQVESEYTLFMKKCIVTEQMKDPENAKKFQELRLSNKCEEKVYKYYGRVENFNEQVFFQNQDRIQSDLLQHHYPDINKTLNQIYNRYLRYQKIDMFDFQIKKEECPLALADYDKLQQEYHLKQKELLQKQFREFLIDEIYDLGKKNRVFDCYKIDLEKYSSSEQFQFYKLIDLIFSNFIRYCVVKNTCDQYVEFIQSFTIPYSMEIFKKLWINIHQSIFSKQATIEQQRMQIINQQSIQNSIIQNIRQKFLYNLKSYPLIRLNLVINLNWKKKQPQEKKKKGRRKQRQELTKRRGNSQFASSVTNLF